MGNVFRNRAAAIDAAVGSATRGENKRTKGSEKMTKATKKESGRFSDKDRSIVDRVIKFFGQED